MKLRSRLATLFCLALLVACAPCASADVTVVKPESAGFSTERLSRIDQTMQRHLDAGEIAGAVTAVSRGGTLVRE